MTTMSMNKKNLNSLKQNHATEDEKQNIIDWIFSLHWYYFNAFFSSSRFLLAKSKILINSCFELIDFLMAFAFINKDMSLPFSVLS